MADITTIKFLSLTGLQNYDAKIKAFVESKVAEGDAKSFKYVDLVDGVLKFYTVNPITNDTTPAFEIELPEQDLSHLMELVADAKENNVAVFDANGQVKDGGLAVGDIATKAEVQAVQTDVEELADLVGVIPEGYEATTIAQYAKELADNVAANGYDDTELAGRVTAIEEDYLTSEDKTELEGKIGAAQAKGEEALTHSEGVAGDLATETTERKAADEAQVGRIAALEEQIVGLSGAMHFKGVIEGDALPETTEGYEDGDVVIFGNKEYVVNNGAFVEFGDVNAQAEAITELVGRMDTAEGEIDQLQTDLDAAEEALAKKAEQSALDQEIADREAADEQVLKDAKDYTDTEVAKDRERLTALEGADEALEGRVKANEDAIAAINNEETGILKQAKDHADGLMEAEVEARNTAIATAKGEAIAEAETKDATVLANAKAHAEEKDAENLEAAKTYTNEEIAKIDLSGITTNAGNITALQEDVAELQAVQHEEISVEEINSLFPEE